MPYANLAQSELEVYWTSNIPNDNLSRIRSDPKPVVLMLHAIMLSTEWRREQLTDPFLSQSCYMIAFDGVTCGRTRCPTYASKPLANQHDAWAEAAMIALFARELDLPPFHIFAEQIIAIKASERFAILFPNQLLSLTYVGVPPPLDEPWVLEGYMQAVIAWIHAQDLESLEEAQAALGWFYFSTHSRPICLTEEEMDRLMEHFQINHHPADSARGLLGIGITVRTRQPLRPEELAMIHHPVHMIQGDSSPVHTADPAFDLQAQLVNARCAQIDLIQGGPDCVGVPARFAPAVNRSFATFLFSPRSEDKTNPGPCTVDTTDLRRALALNAKLEGKPEMNQLDPESMWSFCRMPPDAKELVESFFIPTYIEAAKNGRSLLGPDGKPKRKYSERHADSFASSVQQPRRASVVSRVTVRGQT